MKRTFYSRPTPSMIVALVALFVAMGGVSYAAVTIGSAQIKNNSVRSKDIRNNDVRGKDVRDGSLLKKDFRKGQLPSGPAGQRGPAGLTGTEGPVGPQGPSDAYHIASDSVSGAGNPKTVSLVLPEGDYAVATSVGMYNAIANPQTSTTCTLSSAKDANPEHKLALLNNPTNGYENAAGQIIQELPAGGTVKLACSATVGVSYGQVRITATRVGAIHEQ